ncbi:MAG: hypothetical protein JWR69_2546 [Pedosphaera sp.]|nr:hypothetical protein [Pedosphaera sp.]
MIEHYQTSKRIHPLGFPHPHKCLSLALLLAIFVLSLPVPAATPAFTTGSSQGTVSVPGLSEASGVVASRNNDSVLWTHNDSGDSARIFALDTQGRYLGTYALPGAANVDYEDIAIGPGPVTNVSYLYVGDIGDNTDVRANIKIYQIPEPAVYSRQHLSPVNAALKGVRAITLTYPDGPHNAEALLIDPWTGDLFVATKHATTSRIYTATKAGLDATNSLTLTFVRTVSFDVPSGGDISPSGLEIVLRQEDFARLWPRLPGQTIANAFDSAPVTIPVIGTPTEPNGEAIGFDAIGSGYYTLSDSATTQPLYYFQRTSTLKWPRFLVPAGSSWKYLDTGTNLNTSWRNPGFNDAVWNTGPARFGYAMGNEDTALSYGPDPNKKYITTYFRTTFTLANAESITNLALKIVCDDGAAVYLNGTPIAQAFLNPGAAYNTPATATQTNLEDTWFTFPVDPASLINGTNTLAVEVHQAAVNSPDLAFDLQLLALESSATRFTAATPQPNHQLQLRLSGPFNSNVTLQSSLDLSNWSSLGTLTLTNGAAVFRETNATLPRQFYRLSLP